MQISSHRSLLMIKLGAIFLLLSFSNCSVPPKTPINASSTVASSSAPVSIVGQSLSATAQFYSSTSNLIVGNIVSVLVTATGGSGSYQAVASGATAVNFSSSQVGASAQTYLSITLSNAGTYPIAVTVSDTINTSSSVVASTPTSITVGAAASVPPTPPPPSFTVVLQPGNVYLGQSITLYVVPDTTSGPIYNNGYYMNGNAMMVPYVFTPSVVGTSVNTVTAVGPGGSKTVTVQYNVYDPLPPQMIKTYLFSYTDNQGNYTWLPSLSASEVGSPWVNQGYQYSLLASNAGVSTAAAIYRCYFVTGGGIGDHFLSTQANCEGVAGTTNEGVMGYLSTTSISYSGCNPVQIFRHRDSVSGTHFTNSSAVSQFPRDIVEGPQGYAWSC